MIKKKNVKGHIQVNIETNKHNGRHTFVSIFVIITYGMVKTRTLDVYSHLICDNLV